MEIASSNASVDCKQVGTSVRLSSRVRPLWPVIGRVQVGDFECAGNDVDATVCL
jgi:hypothetical protein